MNFDNTHEVIYFTKLAYPRAIQRCMRTLQPISTGPRSKLKRASAQEFSVIANSPSSQDSRKSMDVELAHYRFGNLPISTLLTASQDHLWADTKLRLGTDPLCHDCIISTKRKANRTFKKVSTQTYPGQV